jgi:hypothetical protein
MIRLHWLPIVRGWRGAGTPTLEDLCGGRGCVGARSQPLQFGQPVGRWRLEFGQPLLGEVAGQ